MTAAIGRVLIIAGSDSGGGAGVQADIKTVTVLGGYAASAITAITVQNTLGVFGVHPIPVEVVTAQAKAVLDDPNAALPGDLEPGSAQPPLATALSGWSALTASNLNSNGIPIVAVRLTITANTGTAVFQVLQTGIGS